MKYVIFIIVRDIELSFNLSHMDFLDDPAAIHGSRLTISRFTKDESPNEHIDPEI